jgi:hypothetical protein
MKEFMLVAQQYKIQTASYGITLLIWGAFNQIENIVKITEFKFLQQTRAIRKACE